MPDMPPSPPDRDLDDHAYAPPPSRRSVCLAGAVAEIIGTPTVATDSPDPSTQGRERFKTLETRPLFLADWIDALFIHLEVPARVLQPEIPFTLDARDGRAFISLVAFTMRGMRFAGLGRVGAWLTAPIATHPLLNVRTYVRHDGEPAIYFMREWIPNPISAWLGPRTFGLPYRRGRLCYHHDAENGVIEGLVEPYEVAGRLRYCGRVHRAPAAPAAAGSLAEFLLERYTAFTHERRRARLFRVWHEPWPIRGVDIDRLELDALSHLGDWCHRATLVDAHFSRGVHDVWMGRPRHATQTPST